MLRSYRFWKTDRKKWPEWKYILHMKKGLDRFKYYKNWVIGVRIGALLQVKTKSRKNWTVNGDKRLKSFL